MVIKIKLVKYFSFMILMLYFKCTVRERGKTKNNQKEFNEIINLIETRRLNAYRKINEELISLYWDFGKYVSDKVNNNNWGNKLLIY